MPFKPGPRRSSWRWVGPVALTAAAVVAVAVTLRFAPMVEEASRKARESDVAPPPRAPTSAPVASGEGEREGNQAQMKDERTTQDRLWQSEPPAHLDQAAPIAPSQRSADVAAAPTQARPQAPLPSAQPAPPAAAAGRPAERLAPKAAPPPLEEAKKEDSREKALVERSAIAAAAKTAATPVRAERRRDSGPIVVVARTNLDAAWRLSGNGIDRSDDAGKTWRPQMSFTAAALLTGSAPSAEICWVAGQGGVVLRTTDGEHWERLISPTQDDLVQITAWNASSATIKSASGARFSTNDGGQTWSRL
jgi:photosynthesis system II assembly factor YCF48-like protein